MKRLTASRPDCPRWPHSVRRHQEAGAGNHRRRGDPLWHVLRQQPLAGRHVDQFPDHPDPIDHLVRLEKRTANGEFERLPKKDVLKLEEEIERAQPLLAVSRNHPLARRRLHRRPERGKPGRGRDESPGIPIVALVDTNCNPTSSTTPSRPTTTPSVPCVLTAASPTPCSRASPCARRWPPRRRRLPTRLPRPPPRPKESRLMPPLLLPWPAI